MPVNPEKVCFWDGPISSTVGLPPAFHAERMTVLSNASVEARWVPSVGATVLPVLKPPEASGAPRETFETSHDPKPPSLPVVVPDWVIEAWFCEAIASKSILMRGRPSSPAPGWPRW